MEYKGISKAESPNWAGWKYIETYKACDNLETDVQLQNLVNQYHAKIKLVPIVFNLGIWLIIGLAIYYIKG